MRRPKALMNCIREMDALNASNPNDPRVVKARTKWYDIRNEADAESEIFIYEEIGYWGITSDDFIRDLNALNTKSIKVRINSPGGSVWDAIAIHSALVAHSATVNVQIDSLAASAASVIAMAGDKITMMRGSQMMIHDAIGIGMGNEAELIEYAKWLGEQSNNIADMYAARAGGTAEDWRAMMLAETWLFAAEAVEAGLADEIYTKPKQAEPEPDEEQEDAPEEETEEEAPEEEEPTPEDRLAARHRLTNRGYKYCGRNKAPEPVINSGFTDLLNAWR